MSWVVSQYGDLLSLLSMEALTVLLVIAVLALVVGFIRLSLQVGKLSRDVALLKGMPLPPPQKTKLSILAWLLLAPGSLAGTTQQATAAAYADSVKLGRQLEAAKADGRDLEAYKYFWISTPEGKEREYFVAVFSLHVRLLSRYSQFLPEQIVRVAPDLLRVDMDTLKWDRATLEAARFIDPFFHRQVEYDPKIHTPGTIKFYWPGGVDTAPGPTKGQFTPRGKYTVNFNADSAPQPFAAPHLPPKEIEALRINLFSETPILCAEWFLANSARQIGVFNDETGIGYYDFFGADLKDRDSFFRYIGFSESKSVQLGKDFLEVIERSGVAQFPRVVASGNSVAGDLFITLDTDKPRGRGIALRDLRKGAFRFQIQEFYVPKPDGLPLTFLSNEKGERQDNAPGDKGGFVDDSTLRKGKDGRIHINLACMRCHAGLVLHPLNGYVRHMFANPKGIGVTTKREYLRTFEQYFSDLGDRIVQNRVQYQRAFRKATTTDAFPKGMSAQEAAEGYAYFFHAYVDDPVTPNKAAIELGVRGADFYKALVFVQMTKGLDTRLAPFTADPALPLSRQTWEESYPVAMEIASGFLPLPTKP